MSTGEYFLPRRCNDKNANYFYYTVQSSNFQNNVVFIVDNDGNKKTWKETLTISLLLPSSLHLVKLTFFVILSKIVTGGFLCRFTKRSCFFYSFKLPWRTKLCQFAFFTIITVTYWYCTTMIWIFKCLLQCLLFFKDNNYVVDTCFCLSFI